jgi:hypothetical protein
MAEGRFCFQYPKPDRLLEQSASSIKPRWLYRYAL